jgi:hypothetical protein
MVKHGAFDPDADSASLISETGNTKVFEHESQQEKPTQVSNASVDQHAGEEVAKLQQAKKQLFAQELQQTLREKGFDIVVITDGSNELVLDSDDIFQKTSTRVMFVNSVLPKWGPVLCRAGFTEVRIRGRGFFEMGQDFPVSCY